MPKGIIRYSELLEATLRKEKTETIPVAFWQHHPVADQSLEMLVEATCQFQHQFDLDLVKITPASTWQLRDFGLSDSWDGDLVGRRSFGPPIIKHPEDWHRLAERLYPGDHATMHLRAVRQIRKRFSNHIPVLQTVFNPIFLAQKLSQNHWQQQINEYPADVKIGIEALTKATQGLIEKLLDEGVDGIYYAIQHANAEQMSYSDYLQLAAPSDAACLQLAADGGRYNLIHLHGHEIFTDMISSYPVRHLHYHFVEQNPLPEVVSEHEQALVSGGPSSQWFYQASPNEVTIVAQALRTRMRDFPYLMSAGCVCYPSTPKANIQAAVKVARCREGF